MIISFEMFMKPICSFYYLILGYYGLLWVIMGKFPTKSQYSLCDMGLQFLLLLVLKYGLWVIGL